MEFLPNSDWNTGIESVTSLKLNLPISSKSFGSDNFVKAPLDHYLIVVDEHYEIVISILGK